MSVKVLTSILIKWELISTEEMGINIYKGTDMC